MKIHPLRLGLGVALVLALGGCGGGTSDVDAGTDAGGGTDSGVADSGATDSGATDAGPTDAGPTDAGSAPDFGPDFMAIAPCNTPSDYMMPAGSVTVTAGVGGSVYAPRCLKVAPGTMVTIQGSLTHPLLARTGGTTPNTVPTGPSTTDQALTFSTAGFFPYQCANHGPFGMQGVVWVQ